SLFKDAFISWQPEQIDRWLHLYHERAQAAALPVPADFAQFKQMLDLMGVQRHLKVIGIFARIAHRDHKPQYLADVPRFIRYIRDVAPQYPPLKPLLDLFDTYLEPVE
ncbi:MAG TPA: aminoglycoside phosphotransferase, partial [Gammaproteobacteria bacterium]|nr:aminoglycoside phosphotransferase [Gammaproteobacteria bacterium]